jgi:proline iminopeptidase
VVKKAFKYIGIAIACIVGVVLLSASLYRKFLQHKVAEERAITSPSGINSLESVRIGGINQWIEVRGQNVNNPILLFIHGGPGIAFIPLAGAWQASWERHFTVVQWDQRGAGKTYASNDQELQRRTMNVPQMEQDTLEVVNYLRNRFKREKIFVLGHSWGSVLGLWLAHEHPQLIYAYVGVGQVINTEQKEVVEYQDALEEGHKRHNEQAVKTLESIAPLSTSKPGFRKDVDLERLGTGFTWAAPEHTGVYGYQENFVRGCVSSRIFPCG